MKRYLVCLILGIAIGGWGDRTIRNTIASLPLPDFIKTPIVEAYGK